MIPDLNEILLVSKEFQKSLSSLPPHFMPTTTDFQESKSPSSLKCLKPSWLQAIAEVCTVYLFVRVKIHWGLFCFVGQGLAKWMGMGLLLQSSTLALCSCFGMVVFVCKGVMDGGDKLTSVFAVVLAGQEVFWFCLVCLLRIFPKKYLLHVRRVKNLCTLWEFILKENYYNVHHIIVFSSTFVCCQRNWSGWLGVHSTLVLVWFFKTPPYNHMWQT